VGTCDSETVEFRVRDQGIGIPSGERTAIFSKFYRLSPVLPWRQSTAPQGTGLGLTICASIVRAHGGHIWVEDTDASGTTVVVTLPRPSKEAQEAQYYEEAPRFEEVMV
jgi:two-component system sensor histidine kinase KdpD